MNLALINPKVWLELAVAAILASACWYGYNWVYDRGSEHVQAKWDAVEKDRTAAVLKATQDAIAVTANLQDKADKQHGETNAQINALNLNLGSALAGLRERPARPGGGGLPQVAGAGTGCTGASLYASDAEFLIRESHRADRLRVDLQACQAAYGAARSALNASAP